MTASLVVDILIVAIAIIALVSGWRQGAVSAILSAVGIVAGLIIGVVLAPPVMGLTSSTALRFLLGLGVVVLLAAIGNAIGATLGSRLRDGMRTKSVQSIDSVIGAAFMVLVTFFVAWFIAVPLATGLGKPAADGIRQSTILRSVDSVMPRALSHLPARTSAMLNESGLPPLVSPFRSDTASSVSAPRVEVANKELVDALRPAIIHVMGDSHSCQRRLLGSGFVISPDYVLTNAHVVAGTQRVHLDTMLGLKDADVVMYDPEADIAVLHSPDLGIEPMEWADAPAVAGDDAIVLGFPESGPFEAAPARVADRIVIDGPNIYATGRVERDSYAVRGTIREGNSGGPLVDDQGKVLGMVFGAAIDNSDTGFALTRQEIEERVGDIRQHTESVSTQQCVA